MPRYKQISPFKLRKGQKCRLLEDGYDAKFIGIEHVTNHRALAHYDCPQLNLNVSGIMFNQNARLNVWIEDKT